MFIVNAPFMFKAVWNVLQSFMDARTREKITMCGSNYRATLLEVIHEEDLPEFLGGTCACPGGCCHAGAGPWRDFPPSARRKGVPPLGEQTGVENEDKTVTCNLIGHLSGSRVACDHTQARMLRLAQEALERAENEEEKELTEVS